jgi:hypothetical protein
MSEPDSTATDAELSEYYGPEQNGDWGDEKPIHRPDRLDVTISVRFTPAEIAAIRSRAADASLKPTAYIRRCALAQDAAPIDRAVLRRSIATLSNDLDDLRRAAG